MTSRRDPADAHGRPTTVDLPSDESLTLAEIRADEDRLQFNRFTNDDAWVLGVALVNEAHRRGLAIAIDISRANQQLFHAGLDGTTPDNDAWLIRKGRTVLRFHHSSLYVGQLCRDQHTTPTEKFGLAAVDFAAAGGGFPVRVRDVGVVGYVAVSGLRELQDHHFLVSVLEDFLRTRGPLDPPTTTADAP